MALTNDTVMLFLVLMPGFLSSIILNMLIVRKPPDGLIVVIEALVFSFIIYVCWSLLSGQMLVTVGTSGAISPGVISRKSLVGVTVLSIFFPVVFGTLLTHDVLLRVLRKLFVTRRTGRGSVWLDMFLDQRRYVIVNFVDGRRLFGWPQYYSDDASEGMLYIYDPSWIDSDGCYVSLGVHGFFITNRASVDSITFTHLDHAKVKYQATYGEASSDQAPETFSAPISFSGI